MTVAQRIRVTYRTALILLWTAGLLLVRLAATPMRLFARGGDIWVRRHVFRTWARGILRLSGVRVDVRGPVPRPPFFSVSNHLTNLDLIVLVSRTGCLFVSRGDVAKWPIIGPVVTVMDTIYIDRSRKSDTLRVNTLIQQALDRGDAVHVFAESRIAHDGQVHDFKPALLEPAVSRGLPVHYAALSYRTDPGSPAAAEAVVWGDDISFLKHLANLLALPRVYALVAFGDRPIAGTDRKSLAEALCNAVRAQYVPIDTIPPTHGGPAQGL